MPAYITSESVGSITTETTISRFRKVPEFNLLHSSGIGVGEGVGVVVGVNVGVGEDVTVAVGVSVMVGVIVGVLVGPAIATLSGEFG
jgi:hypothetical protein